MTTHKLIFVGPVGAGKTTAITTLSDSDAVSTDAKATDSTGLRKQTTTVALDFGQLTLSDDHKVSLYGTPGQIRFSFMWDLMSNDLAADAHSVILLLDNTRNQPQRDLLFYVQEFAELIKHSRLIIAVTRSDLRSEPTCEHYHAWIDALPFPATLFFVDARDKSSLLPLIREALPPILDDTHWQQLYLAAQTDIPILNPLPQTDTAAISAYQGDKLVIKDTIIDDITTLNGVQGALLTNAMGEIIHTSLDHPALEDYIAYMAGMVPAFQHASAFENPRSIFLKSPKGRHVGIFIEEEQVLGVLCTQRTSIRTLKQQVEDILQWG